MAKRYGSPPWSVVEDKEHWFICLIDADGNQVMGELTTPETATEQYTRFSEYARRFNDVKPVLKAQNAKDFLKLL